MFGKWILGRILSRWVEWRDEARTVEGKKKKGEQLLLEFQESIFPEKVIIGCMRFPVRPCVPALLHCHKGQRYGPVAEVSPGWSWPCHWRKHTGERGGRGQENISYAERGQGQRGRDETDKVNQLVRSEVGKTEKTNTALTVGKMILLSGIKCTSQTQKKMKIIVKWAGRCLGIKNENGGTCRATLWGNCKDDSGMVIEGLIEIKSLVCLNDVKWYKN